MRYTFLNGPPTPLALVKLIKNKTLGVVRKAGIRHAIAINYDPMVNYKCVTGEPEIAADIGTISDPDNSSRFMIFDNKTDIYYNFSSVPITYILHRTEGTLHNQTLLCQSPLLSCSKIPISKERYRMQARSQPARWGGIWTWMGGTPGAPPPLGHCPRDVINLKNAPTLGHSQAPPPLDIARVTSSIWKTPPLLDIHKHPPPPWTLPVWRHPHIPRVEQNCWRVEQNCWKVEQNC